VCEQHPDDRTSWYCACNVHQSLTWVLENDAGTHNGVVMKSTAGYFEGLANGEIHVVWMLHQERFELL
jgi:hypothetical protein